MRQMLMVSATLIVLAVPSVAARRMAIHRCRASAASHSGRLRPGHVDGFDFRRQHRRRLTPNIQIVGEVGRLSDIKPPLLDLLDFTPFDLRVSACSMEKPASASSRRLIPMCVPTLRPRPEWRV